MKKDYGEQMVVQEWMTTALLELMKEQSYDSITVTQITKKAGVSRMTYYRNYVEKEDILEFYGKYLTELLAQKIRNTASFSAKGYWKLLFDFILENREYLEILINSGKDEIILNAMNENIENITDGNKKYAARFGVGAFYNITLSWVKDSFKESPSELSNIMFSLMNQNCTEFMVNAYTNHFNKL